MQRRHLVGATVLGMALRLFFIVQFPYIAGDSDMYKELAEHLAVAHTFAIEWNDALLPVDMRMPGYPFFLAGVRLVAGPSDQALMVAQACLDMLTCLGIAWLAGMLAGDRFPRAQTIAFWLAALCPFTANYVSTPLTETLAIAGTTWSLLLLCDERWFLASLAMGFTTMVRPESPLLLVAAGLALVWKRRPIRELVRTALLMAAGLFLVLLPWGYRNWVMVGSFDVIPNPDAIMPWERSYHGFGDWERTWLVSTKQTYDFEFKFEEENIDPKDLPPMAYDSPAEHQREVELLALYNVDKSASPQLHWEFEQLARERARRNPFRQYVEVPFLRGVNYWFTPRIQTLPYSDGFWPPRQRWQDDKKDFSVTLGFFVLNIVYLALGLWGAWRARGQLPVAIILIFMVVRTLFFLEHGTIEPRYTLLCFPGLLALAAIALASRKDVIQPQ